MSSRATPLRIRPELDSIVVRRMANGLVGNEVVQLDAASDVLLVQPLMAAICGTDIGMARGLRPEVPRVFGHEFVGEVVRSGPSFGAFPVGSRVTVNPNRLDNNAHERFGETADGAFRSLITFDTSFLKFGQLFRVSDDLPLTKAALIEPVACVIHAHDSISAQLTGGHVAIIGGGNFAKLHSVLASELARDVTVLIPNASRHEDAVSSGLFTGNVIGLADASKALANTFDAVIIAVSQGTLTFFNDAVRLVSEGGVIHFWGPVAADVVLIDERRIGHVPATLRQRNATETLLPPEVARFSTKDILLTGTRGPRNLDFHQAIARLATAPVDRIISHVTSLDALPDVISAMIPAAGWRSYPGKVLVDFSLRSGVMTRAQHDTAIALAPPSDTLSALAGELARSRMTHGLDLEAQDSELLAHAYALAQLVYVDDNGAAKPHPANGLPIMEHVIDVAFALLSYDTTDVELIAAALLHDALEYSEGCSPAIRGLSERIHDIAEDLSQSVSSPLHHDTVDELLREARELSNDQSLAWEPNALVKFEHFTRLLHKPRDTRSSKLKLVDNLVAYSARSNTGALKVRSPLELTMFEAFANRVLAPTDDLLCEQLTICLDTLWREVVPTELSELRGQLSTTWFATA